MDQGINDNIIHFLMRKASAEDVQALQKWLEASPTHRDELKLWFKTCDVADMAENAERYQPEEAYQRFLFRLEQGTSPEIPKTPQGKNWLRYISRIAAVFVIGLSTGLLAHFYLSQPQLTKIAFVENIIPLGSKSEIRLPDGSTVWLNAGSKLRYPTDYGISTREVYLEGEGYFKVAKQAKKPFTVHTPAMNVRALGTEFNVRAYPDEKVTETMLVSGEVLIDNGETEAQIKQPVVLKPGQKFSIAIPSDLQYPNHSVAKKEEVAAAKKLPTPVVQQLRPAVIDAEISWKESKWRIEREELQRLAVKLERRYDVKIEIEDRLKTYSFSGTLKDESLEQVLTAMQFSSPILFTVKGKNVTIYMDKKKNDLTNNN